MPNPPRTDGRHLDELRPVVLQMDFQTHPAGSVLIQCGGTRIICAVSVVDGVPRWMREQNVPGGWLTCEYQMLPSATRQRTQREATRGQLSGRSQEIQRLIGRSLRSVVDLEKIGARTLQVDCDVIDADGGTRCASITGACVAVETALRRLYGAGSLGQWPMKGRVAAVSVGMVAGRAMLDLCYAEDAAAEVDMNVVMTGGGDFVEVQGTAEGVPFSHKALHEMLKLAEKGNAELIALQASVMG